MTKGRIDIGEQAPRAPDRLASAAADEILRELELGQVELELQNEALRQSRVALEESRDRYVDFYDFAPVGYLTLSADGSIAEVNLTGADMLGVERAKLAGRRFITFVAAEDADHWHRLFISAMRQDEKVECEVALLRPDGTRLDVRLDCLHRDPTGQAPTLRLVLSDIAARKHAEEQLREMAASLEAKVADRTHQLRSLSAELSMTEERERRLLAKDLHDNLGQLLAVIKIKLTSLAAGAPQAQIDQIVGLVDQAGESARMVTSRLSPPILQTLGFVPALEWLADEIERTFGLRVHVAAECRRMQLDEHVRAILYRSARELLINVARHAGVGAATLSSMCDGHRLILTVSDDGRGFDPADLPAILAGRIGFGLGSINEHVAHVGGLMEFDSTPGNGTTVTLTLPCFLKDEACPHDSDRSCR